MKRLFFIALIVFGLALLAVTLSQGASQSAESPVQESGPNLLNSLVKDIPSQVAPISTPVSFTEIFDEDTKEVSSTSTRILVTGDVLPAREVNNRAAARNNWNGPYEKTADRLRAADITFINLETPLVNGCQRTQTGMIFCGDVRNVQGLQFAGVDVASLANNHALNQGNEGFTETAELLERSGILPVGDSQQPKTLERNGTTFAFLAYNDVGEQSELLMAAAQPERIRNDILLAKQQADVVILQFHWGEEYRRLPTWRQQELAHFSIDNGAGLVLGNHPHWFQAVEMYKDKLITYSHGNFVFDQMWSLETRQGVVGEYIFEGSVLVDVIYHPVQIEDYGQPRWLEGEEKSQVLEELRRASLEQRDMKSSGDIPSSM